MKAIIEKFVSDKNIALIGVSANKQKFGNSIFAELTKKGYSVFPVHPTLNEINGIKCFPNIQALPYHVNNLILIVNPTLAEYLVSHLNDSPIRRVWMHQGVGIGPGSNEAIAICKKNGIEVVYGFCPMMFFSASGIHRFHFWLRKNFGKVPAEFNL